MIRPAAESSNAAPYAERRDTDGPGSTFDQMLAAAATRSIGWFNVGRRRTAELADRVVALEPELTHLSDARLTERVADCRSALIIGGLTEDAVVEAFALAREATRRERGFRHHRVQVIGGLTMLDGRLAEMETGEGKTLTALLPAAAAALAGIPTHVVTVNEYLAERDAAELGPIYRRLGLSVGLILPDHEPDDRKIAYRADVTYCTNKDLVFDYLRDRLAIGQQRSRARRLLREISGRGGGDSLLLRGLHFAIVDEADSVLIDEARTPLILSATEDSEGQLEMRQFALEIAGELVGNRDFKLVARTKQIELLPAGEERIAERTKGLPGIWIARRARHELVGQALSAIYLYKKDVNYIIGDDDKIQIIDEYTGRVMPDRSWENGLHQMVETKEGVPLTGQRRTIARITYQRFFGRYLRLAGMTGTITEAAGEMGATLGLQSVRIDTNSPLIRRDLGTRMARNADEKWQMVAAAARHQAIGLGRPVLIGTRSVGASEALSAVLNQLELDHFVLNARQDSQEAEIVANAGQPGRVTVATNMAGRGTDIKLTREAREAGGLHVILTEFHESARIDRQLFGRSARQGDPGSYEAIVAIDDDLFARFGGGARAIADQLLALGGARWEQIAARTMRRHAQNAAERYNRMIRMNTIRQDYELDRQLAFSGRTE